MKTIFACEVEDREALIESLRSVAPFGRPATQMSGWPEIGDIVENPVEWVAPCVQTNRTVIVRWEDESRSTIVAHGRDDKVIRFFTGRTRLEKAFFDRLMLNHTLRVLCASWEHFEDAARLMGHMTHLGWGCFFKGAGHDHFVSPRWLEHGPWLLERHGEVTYVQLYDLALEGDAAWQQARRAMHRLSEGFFSRYGYSEVPVRGHYVAAERTFTVVKTDQGVTQGELWDYCLLRAMCRDHEAEPIEHVRVIFTEERDARRHLHELWLRGLECWALAADGRRVRLDVDYQPPPQIYPEWVERHLGLPASGPYASPVRAAGPPPAPGAGPGINPKGVRLSLGLSSLVGVLSKDERRSLLMALLRQTAAKGLCDVPGQADGADAHAAYIGVVDVRWPGADVGFALTEAALASTSFAVDVFLAPELIGVSLPAILVGSEVPSQVPLRARELGAVAGEPPGARLLGATVLPVDDVLARVAALSREDLRCAEGLLELCSKHRLVVVATARPSE